MIRNEESFRALPGGHGINMSAGFNVPGGGLVLPLDKTRSNSPMGDVGMLRGAGIVENRSTGFQPVSTARMAVVR